MRTFLRGKVTLLFMMLGMLLAIPAVALADQIVGDADVIDANIQGSENLGTVAPGATLSPNPQVGFWLDCNGNNHLNPGQTVNITFGSASWSRVGGGSFSGHSATATPTSLTAPSTWPSDGTTCSAAGNPADFEGSGESTATITAPTTPGTYNVVLSYNKNIGSPDITGQTQVTFTLTVPSDTTGPVITKTVTGTLGDNDWYTSNVNVDWTVSDPESAISSQSGCADFSVTSDQNAQTYTCTATSAGGTSSQSVTIKRDATAPTNVAGVLARAADSNGWYNHAIDATFDGDDVTSGIASCSSDGAYDGPDGTGKTVTGSCTDEAGNSANGSSPTFNYDATAPDATADADRSADQGGWYNAPFTVSFSGTDATSGNVSCDPAEVNYNGPDTSGDNISSSCTDEAGNSDSATFDFKYDNTDPTISGAKSPAATSFGWNNGPVTVSYTCADNLSGVAPADCGPDQTLSSEGTGQSSTGTATDGAGNAASTTVSGINIDLTNPLVSLVDGPANLGSYYFGFVPSAPTCSASDAPSGLAAPCSVSGYGTTVGNHTVTASAKDKADNTASDSHTYDVLGWTFNGFYQPVDMGTTLNTVKGGSTVPFKFELFAGPTELTSTSYVNQPLKATKVNCDSGATEDTIELVATGGTQLRYDTTGGQYIYNWQTPKQAGACYNVTITANDGSSKTAHFKLR